MYASNALSATASPPPASNMLIGKVGIGRALDEQSVDLQHVEVGTILHDVGDNLEYAYFPVDTMIALEQPGGVEVALAGREGMSGWTAIGGCNLSPYRAVVRCRAGFVVRVRLDILLAAIATSPSLRALLYQYVVVTAVQMAEGLGAHSHHRLEAAVARWLLLRHDRVGGDWVFAQHQEIANSLGARRASVTDCLHILEGDRHLRCRRGRILIRDRSTLEVRAFGAYGAAESLYRSSFGAFGKTLLAV